MKPENTEKALKQIIDREGINYLSTNSYDIYLELLENKQADSRTARLILITLLAGVQKQAAKDPPAPSTLSAYIQRNCSLKKSAADQLADLYCSLFNAENRKDWEGKSEEGYRKFCGQEWDYDMDSEAAFRTMSASLCTTCRRR